MFQIGYLGNGVAGWEVRGGSRRKAATSVPPFARVAKGVAPQRPLPPPFLRLLSVLAQVAITKRVKCKLMLVYC